MITVRFFAVVRERAEADGMTFELTTLPEPTVFHAIEHICAIYPAVGPLVEHLRIAVDHEFVSPDATLADGSEIALIPPVSGGSTTLTSHDARFAITTDPLDARAVNDLVRRDEAGALVTFEGTVRNHTDDHDVDHLEYEAYPEMALKKLEEVAERAADQWPAAVAIHHRYGKLAIGDCAVVIAVTTPHRADGYACSQWIIDRLKEEVPIWKKEVGPDGSTWVGFGP